MNLRRLSLLSLGFLALLACSRSSEDAGIVLVVDTTVAADRNAINRIVVTVDGVRKEWSLSTTPLPGSLGIETSPGNKSVVVDGYSNSVLRGTWSGSIVASQGKVVVRDVHLSHVEPGTDGGLADGPADGKRDATDTTADTAEAGRSDAEAVDGGKDTLDTGRSDTADGGAADGKDGGYDGGEIGSDGSKDLKDSNGNDVGGAGDVGKDGNTDVTSVGDAFGKDVAPSGDVQGEDNAGNDAGSGLAGLPGGVFHVASAFQTPATAASPGPVGSTLHLVHGLVDDPGSAILDFAGDAGVPGLSTLRSALPDSLESRLSGWMSSYIKDTNVGGVSPYDKLAWIDGIIQSLLLSWGLESHLVLPLDSPGTHVPVALTFAPPTGPPLSIPVEITAQVTSGIGVLASLSWPAGLNGTVTISDHFMGIPFGRYALRALNTILQSEFGVPNLAAYLSDAVGCDGMASYVASQCVSIVCVGHKDDLLDVCQGGLAEAAAQIEDQILAVDFKTLRFERGVAVAVGAGVEHMQDVLGLQDGVWTASVDFGNGSEPTSATFSAVAESTGR
jgi:hypothetical protein